MNKNPMLRYVLLTLLAIALLLPIAFVVIVAMAALLGSMGDTTGGIALQRVALGLGIFWIINLILLVLAGAVLVLADTARPLPNEPHEHDLE